LNGRRRDRDPPKCSARRCPVNGAPVVWAFGFPETMSCRRAMKYGGRYAVVGGRF